MSKLLNLNVCRVAAVLVLVALAACKSTEGGKAQTCPPLTKEDRAALSANTKAWVTAVRKADWTAVAATYTSDGLLLPPNEPPVSGRDAIRKWFAAFPPVVSIELEDAEINGCGDLAYARGTYHLTIAPPGAGKISETGKYVEVRRKQADGTWLKSHDMFSSNAAAPH